MYGLWLFKELKTEYGYCKVDIYRKGYTASAIEIGGFVGDSLSIALENLDTITAPVGKSVCSFAIYDTEQVEYDDLFSPDATAFKVVVSTRVGSGAYVTRWSGYITPDFFAENLSYRTPISISARDNIGYLNDVDFDLTATTITVREFIQSAFTRIAEDYPMSLSFVSQKQTAEGILAIDATISTTLLREMSWGEALETILHDLGLQMRWVDNNTIAVLDLSQIPEYYATQGFNFIEASGYREIVPAWRQLSQEQDYGLRENFFEGWLREDNITFVKSVVMRPPNATNWTTDIAYYVPNNWGVARDIYTTDPSYYGTKFGKKIFFTGVSEEYPTTTYLSWRQQIQSSDVPMKMTFKAFNSVLYPSEKYTNLNTPSGRRLVAYNPKDAFHGQKVGEYLQIGLKINVLLHSGLKTYILRSEWLKINDDGAGWQLDFTLPKVELSYVDGSQATAEEPREEEVTINIATIPYDGELELRIYGWYIVGKHNYWEDDYSVTDYTFDWLKCLSYINEPVFTFNTEDAETGQNSGIIINELHNVSKKEDYIFGEVPEDSGAINTYAGGLFKADGNELVGFQRNADATNYNLLELVGRELIHFNKRNYNRLSGTIKNLNKEPLMFNRLFVREGKKYAPYNYSLNVISNKMNITSMQEVEPYETATFNTIDSQITTGGGTVSGGNNTILQYSEEAGNEKRLYELQTATELEADDAYLLIDKAGFPEARKVHISELGGFDIKQLEQYLESNGYTALLDYWTKDEAHENTIRTRYNVIADGTIAMKDLGDGGSGEVAQGNLDNLSNVQISNPSNGDVLTYDEVNDIWVNKVVKSGLDETELESYLTTNQYAKLSDIPSLDGYALASDLTALRTDFDNLNTLLNANVGGVIDTWNEVVSFLDGYSQSDDLATILSGMNSDIANRVLIEDFEKLEGSVTEIAGYFTNGSANNALKLGGQLPSYYATADALNGVKNDLTSVSNRVQKFEDIIDIDKNGDVYIKGTRNFYTEGGTISMFGLSEGDSGEVASVSIKFEGSDILYNPINGVITLPAYPSAGGGVADSVAWSNVTGKPDFAAVATSGKYSDLSGVPTSLPASDVYSWAKAATKPTYTFSEITGKPTTLGGYGITDALSTSGGTISGGLIITSNLHAPNIWFNAEDNVERILAPYLSLNYDLSYYDGSTWERVLTSKNYSNYALPLSGGTITGDPAQITLKANRSGSDSWVRFTDAETNDLYAIGIRRPADIYGLQYRINDNFYNVYHSGNFNPANYLPLSGGTITAYNAFPLTIKVSTSSNLLTFIAENSIERTVIGYYASSTRGSEFRNATSGSYIGITDAGTPHYNGNTLIHSGNIGSQSVANANSATKLQTARTIWGQSFDGTSDVSGNILLGVGSDYVIGTGYGSSDKSTYNNITIGNSTNGIIYNGGTWTGSTSFNAHTFNTGASANALVINNGGNVLIGTTTDAGYKFAVYGDTLTNTTRTQELRLGAASPAEDFVQNKWYYASIGYEYTDTSPNTLKPDIVFKTMYNTYAEGSGVERMRIKSTGNVLIGDTVDNGAKLQVNGGVTTYGSINMQSVGEIKNALGISRYDNGTGYYVGSRNAGLGVTDGGCLIYTYGSTPISFYTYGSERMRINGSGGNVSIYGNLVATGTIAMGTLSSSSDARLKDNIKLLTDDESLSVLRRLRPSKWNWKSNGALSYGFIAQEVESVASCMVDRMNDEELGQKLYLQYNQLHAFEVGAIQHIDSEVEHLKRDLNTANLRIEKLENELKQYRLCQ